MIETQSFSAKYESRPPGSAITAIVIHDTAGLMPGCLAWLTQLPPTGSSNSSCHVLITLSGEVHRLVPDHFCAWHAGHSVLHDRNNVNDFSLGVELERAADDESGQYPEEQFEAAAQWVAEACDEYGIPLNRVVSHRDIREAYRKHISHSANVRTDPRNFPFPRFLMLVGMKIYQMGIQE